MFGTLASCSVESVWPPRRVIVLGASNVSLGFGTIVQTACQFWGRPLDLLAAFGHGRSYGLRKSLLGRGLPGIRDCGLWEALERRPPAPTAALLTDVGNDLLYDVPVPQIVAWINDCLDRLLQVGARVVMTALPLCSVQSLSPRKFLLVRTLLYPACRLRYATVLERAFDLDRQVHGLAVTRGIRRAAPRSEWYGFDPIHLRRDCRTRAWSEILAPWSDGTATSGPALSPGERVRLRQLVPERRWLFGRERYTAQPSGRFQDGTKLSLY